MTATLLGSQEPRVASWPGYVSSSADEVIEVAEMAGLHLDQWQRMVLRHALGERPDGRWAAFEVGVNVSRQNGKGGILEARELGALYVLGERLTIHSAHQFDTSLEAFRRLLALIEDTPDLERRVQRVSRAHGEEGIELRNGQRIRFRTRTKGGGRGFTGDLLILDEAMILPESAHGALLPTLSARPNPQVWYTGSAVDQTVHADGVVFARVRERGMKGDDPALAYFEWSVDPRDEADEKPMTPDRAPAGLLADPAVWAQANPGLGIRISAEHIGHELRSMDPRTFAVERLGIGDWPSTVVGGETVIDADAWAALEDATSQLVDPVCFAYDVSPDRSAACISVAGLREDGLAHVEVVDHRRGTGWVVDRLIELCERHEPAAVVCDGAGPAASLVHEIEQAGVDVTTVNAQEHAKACGRLYDRVEQKTVRHLGQDMTVAAVKGAARRPLGDAWAWSRKSSSVDITPLVTATLALWGHETAEAASAAPQVAFA